MCACMKIIGYLYEWHWYVCLYASYGEWVYVCACMKIIGYLYEWHWYVCLYASYGEWVCEDNRLFI